MKQTIFSASDQILELENLRSVSCVALDSCNIEFSTIFSPKTGPTLFQSTCLGLTQPFQESCPCVPGSPSLKLDLV